MKTKTIRAYWPPTDSVTLAGVVQGCMAMLLEKMSNDEILSASFGVTVIEQHNVPSQRPQETHPSYEMWVFNNIKEVGTKLVEVTATMGARV
jgi:hypothetical protein